MWRNTAALHWASVPAASVHGAVALAGSPGCYPPEAFWSVKEFCFFFVRSYVTGPRKSLGTMTTSGFCPKSKSWCMRWLQEATGSSMVSVRSIQCGRVKVTPASTAMLAVSLPTKVFDKWAQQILPQLLKMLLPHPVARGGLNVGFCRHFRLAICANLLSPAS